MTIKRNRVSVFSHMFWKSYLEINIISLGVNVTNLSGRKVLRKKS